MDELMTQFIVEARELVQAAIDDLMALESQPDDLMRLDSAFRAIHTLKGSTSLFDMAPLNAALHKAEDNLGRVRAGTAILDITLADAIVAVLEWVDRCVDELERDGVISDALLDRAAGLADALGADHASPVGNAAAAHKKSIAWALELAAGIGGKAAVALRYQPHAECFFGGDDPIALISRVPGLTHLSIEPREPWPAGSALDPFRCNLGFEALSEASLGEVDAVFRLIPDQVEIVPLGETAATEHVPADANETKADAMRSLRVDPDRIDVLLDLVGELMTAKNGMAGLAALATSLPGGSELSRGIASKQKEFDRLSGALYDRVLATRMVPFAQAFRRLPRMVRDLSRRLGRPTELLIQGDAIEADKTIVDELFEPLLHLVRNAMDHGIETAPERLAAGKPAVATLLLRVTGNGDRIAVALSDDGRGIDPAKIRATAIAKGILTAERAAELHDEEALGLLFAAGFSTAAAVSDLSGRGVGLDAVRMTATRLGGSVSLSSRPGSGTTTTLSLPVSFAMTQLLVVSAGGEIYGVPMQSVVETVRLDANAVTPIRSNRAFVLRDRTLPLLSLSDLLGLPAIDQASEITVLVLNIAGQQVGITIDAIEERMETVTRPLGGLLTGMPGVAGTTVLGDGRVLLVLDVAGLLG